MRRCKCGAGVEAAASGGDRNEDHHLIAEFDNIGDLKVGSPVTIAGVKIGDVNSIRFDPKSFKAVVGMRIDKQYNEIPDDSFASIQTQGLLGGKYIGISPGGADSYLKEGGSFYDHTQSAIVLESLINKFFASYSSKGGGDSQGKAADNQSKAESKK